MEITQPLYTESIFMDSGAFTLYAQKVLKRIGAQGQVLAAPKHFGKQQDFSYFDLTKGSEFRTYCDSYAAFFKKVQPSGVMLVNVDVIHNPDLTWDVQRFFEEEHGIQPVPVFHTLTPMGYLDRYLATGKYDLIGIGGFGHGVPMGDYIAWADDVYYRICPESNGFKPVIRTHGFAMTSWRIMVRYPWWSVDSATWVKLSAYGWLYIPPWKDGVGWRYDRRPIQIGTSRNAASVKKDKHIDTCTKSLRDLIARWLDYCKVPEGKLDSKGEEVERGIRTHFVPRSRCNLVYFKGLEASRPEWPYPLDTEIIEGHTVNHRRGFGL